MPVCCRCNASGCCKNCSCKKSCRPCVDCVPLRQGRCYLYSRHLDMRLPPTHKIQTQTLMIQPSSSVQLSLNQGNTNTTIILVEATMSSPFISHPTLLLPHPPNGDLDHILHEGRTIQYHILHEGRTIQRQLSSGPNKSPSHDGKVAQRFSNLIRERKGKSSFTIIPVPRERRPATPRQCGLIR